MNVHVSLFVCMFSSFWQIPRSGIAGSCISVHLTLKEIVKVFSILHSHLHPVLPVFKKKKLKSHCGFNLHTLDG